MKIHFVDSTIEAAIAGAEHHKNSHVLYPHATPDKLIEGVRAASEGVLILASFDDWPLTHIQFILNTLSYLDGAGPEVRQPPEHVYVSWTQSGSAATSLARYNLFRQRRRLALLEYMESELDHEAVRIERIAARRNLFAEVGPSKLPMEAHREKVREAGTRLNAHINAPNPKLAFAHITLVQPLQLNKGEPFCVFDQAIIRGDFSLPPNVFQSLREYNTPNEAGTLIHEGARFFVRNIPREAFDKEPASPIYRITEADRFGKELSDPEPSFHGDGT